MLDYVLDFVREHVALIAVVGVSFTLLSFAAVVSALAHSVRVYLGVLSMIAGGGLLLALFEQATLHQLLVALGICAVYGGGTYLVGYLIALIVRFARNRSAQRQERYRQLQYTLPDRGNSFVRARLNTALNTVEKGSETTWKTEFVYARSLLAKVREAQLSAVDRLQAEEMGKLFALYGKKDGLGAEDLKAVNEAFAMLLKLAAKYGVNP